MQKMAKKIDLNSALKGLYSTYALKNVIIQALKGQK